MSLRLRYQTLNKALTFLFVLLVLNTRPALFGTLFSEVYLVVPLLGLIMIRLMIQRGRIRVRRYRLRSLAILLTLVGWLFAQILLLDSGKIYIGLALVVTIPAVALGSVILIDDGEGVKTALKALIKIIALLSISQMITYAFFLLRMEESILIFEELLETDAVLFTRLYFPFTLTYHFVKIGDLTLDRAVGLWREPGLYQVFIIIAFFAVDFVQIRKRHLLKLLFIFSLLVTFSTTGYVVFLGCLAYKHILLRPAGFLKKALAALILAVLFAAYSSVPKIGLNDKLERNVQRLSSPAVSWRLLVRRPLVGYGLTSEEEFVPGVKLGVSLIASVHKLGLIGLSLWMAVLVYNVFVHYRAATLPLLLAILVTLIIAQPMHVSPFTFFMFLLPTRRLLPRGSGPHIVPLRLARTSRLRN